ncbi:hypothetical protein ACS0TY_002974 [Phlomoides rotata]
MGGLLRYFQYVFLEYIPRKESNPPIRQKRLNFGLRYPITSCVMTDYIIEGTNSTHEMLDRRRGYVCSGQDT